MYNKVMGQKKFFFLVFLLLLSFIGLAIISKEVTVQIGIMGTIITFIYGFFMDGLFKFIEAKYLVFKQNIANISANSQSLYNIAILYGNKKLLSSIKKPLIEFLMSIRDADPEQYDKNQHFIDDLFMTLSPLKPKHLNEANCHREMLRMIQNLSSNREQLEVFGDKYLAGEMKFLFLLFPFVIVLLVILISVHNPFLMVFGFIIIVVLVFNAYLIHDVDNLHYGNYHFNRSNINDLLENIRDN